MAKKILGIDLGTNSLGWAVLEVNKAGTDEHMQLLDKGVVLFDEGVIIEKGSEKSKAAERTGYRMARRKNFRRKLRKYETLKVLSRHKMVPLSLDEVVAWRKSYFKNYPDNPSFRDWLRTDDKMHKNPYYLRAKAVNEKLAPMELGRVFYHLAQRRGFLSNRLERGTENETGKVKQSIAEISKRIEASGAKSLGEYFWQLYQKDRNLPENKIRDHYLGRKEHYEKEFELICQVQDLPEDLCRALRRAIFFQRPLKSQKELVGKCVFEPRKPRIPASHPLFEEFRMWTFLNNIKVKFQTGADSEEGFRFLTDEEKQKLIRILESAPSKKAITFDKLAKALFPDGFPKKTTKMAYYKDPEASTAHMVFNYPMDFSVSTSPVRALFRKYIGDDWEDRIFEYEVIRPNGTKEHRTADYEDIWHVMFSFDDEEKLHAYFTEKLGFDEETAKHFVNFVLPDGYASLSHKAISLILPFLKQGFTYDKAVLLAKIPDIIGRDVWEVPENREKIMAKLEEIFSRNTYEQKLHSAINSVLYDITKNKIYGSEAQESMLRSALIEKFGQRRYKELDENEGLFAAAWQLLQERLKADKIEERFIKQKTIEEKMKEYLLETFFRYSDLLKSYEQEKDEYKKKALAEQLKNIRRAVDSLYHPSMVNIYPRPPLSKDEKRYLASPIIDSIKNPVMMRSMHMLRKLVNELIRKDIVDADTTVHIELARDLNDANRRYAIRQWQKKREEENKKYAEEIRKVFQEQGITREPSADDIRRYRLWKEQGEISIYTGESIPLHDLFDGTKYDFEHTVPRSVSYDNSLANLTIAESYVNRRIKRNKLPSQLNYNDEEVSVTFDEIKKRLEPWQQKIRELRSRIDKNKSATRRATTKEQRDNLIRKRRLDELELDYWQRKVNNFLVEEVDSGFKAAQLNDTRIVTRYARAYLNSVFRTVHTVHGGMVAAFRRLWGFQEEDAKKDRGNHIHHAIDAVFIAAMTRDLYNRLAEALRKQEEGLKNEAKDLIQSMKPWPTFTEDMKRLHETTLIYHDFRDILPKHTRKKWRKRGIIQYHPPQKELPDYLRELINRGIAKEGIHYHKIITDTGEVFYKIPKYLEGDTARGVLHRETFYGAIARKDEEGHIIKDKEGNVQVDYVVRKMVDELDTKTAQNIVDPVIREIVLRDMAKREVLNRQIKELETRLRNATEDQERMWGEQLAKLKEDRRRLFRLPTKKGGFVPIRKVRIKARVKEPIPEFKKHRDLSDKPYKHWYYVENKENYALGMYEGTDKRGRLARDYEMVRNIDAARYFKRSNKDRRKQYPLLPAEKNGLPLKYILKKGMTVLFYRESPEELKELPVEELVKRLYVVTQLGKQTYFIPHQLSGKMTELKKEAIFSPELNGKNIMILTKMNWNFIIDGKDFRISIDGNIKFNF